MNCYLCIESWEVLLSCWRPHKEPDEEGNPRHFRDYVCFSCMIREVLEENAELVPVMKYK
jgi:hypothetical protein